MIELKGKFTTAYIMIDEVESACIDQIYRMANNPAFTNKIVIMPDTHAGKGSVIGFTMPLTEKIISNIVGVDIGCGMLGFNIGQNVVSDNKDELLLLDEKIRKVIPFGNQIQNKSAVPSHYFEKNYPWDEANDVVKKFCVAYNNKFGTDYKPITYTYDWFAAKQKEIKMKQNAELGIGTLGGGELIASMWVNSLQ
jgi:RNA-splicing ligase RtcB